MTEEMVRCPTQPVGWANKSRLVNLFGMLLFSQALEVSDRYPVEVEFRKASPFWMTGKSQRCDTPDASVIRADTSKQ